jgi:hypothetical protein
LNACVDDEIDIQNNLTDHSVEHVQVLIDALPSVLSDEKGQEASRFIGSYAHVFSKSAIDLGRNVMLPQKINTGDHPPVRQPLRRQPQAYQEEIERNVQEL